MAKPASWSRPPVVSRARMTASVKAALREFQKCACPVRQALPMRRQAVLLLRAHLAEGAVEPIGEKDRIVAETLIAARRPHDSAIDPALECRDLTVRPREAQSGDESAAPPLRRRGLF